MDDTAAIIPCYRARDQILEVLEGFGEDVHKIYVVDDACPDGTGRLVEEACKDERVVVLFNDTNLGVGGAVKRGFSEAARAGFTYLVKIDGDGQMDPADISKLVHPIRSGLADYVKGNRYFRPRDLEGMPLVRVLGNGVLSFLTKLSSGYWHIMDPTNGFIAIHSKVFAALEGEKIDDRFFFESDMLCRLHLFHAVVLDVPLAARYGTETSNLQIRDVVGPFLGKHILRTWRRIAYEYFIRDFNVGSAQLVAGVLTLGFGLLYGIQRWVLGQISGVSTETGEIMIAVLPTVVGVQLLLSALNYDIAGRFTQPIHEFLDAPPSGE
jgi:glycosyltransferase involved in cell wall biosynthesis